MLPRRFTLVAIAAIALMPGCGGSERAGTRTAQPLNAVELQARLLTAADLPAGFSPSERSSEGQLVADDPACEEFLNANNTPNTATEAEAYFENDDTDAVLGLGEALASYKAVELAAQEFARGRRILGQCGRIGFPDPEVKGFMVLRERATAKRGDETLAYTLSGELTSEGVARTVVVDIAFVRLGGNILSLVQVSADSVAERSMEDLIDIALKRFQTPLGPSANRKPKRTAFSPPTVFDTTSPVELPVEGTRLVNPLPVALVDSQAWVGAVDSVRAIDSTTGRVLLTLTPQHPPALTSDRAFPLAPSVSRVGGRTTVLASFVVDVPGKGTTPARRVVEVDAIDAAQTRRVWTVEAKLPEWAQPHRTGRYHDVSLVTATVDAETNTLVLAMETDRGATVAVDLATHEVRWSRERFVGWAVAAGSVIGKGRGGVLALSISDGTRRWFRDMDDYQSFEIGLASRSLVDVSGTLYAYPPKGRTYLLDPATGAVRNRLGFAVDECLYDENSMAICKDTREEWAGAFNADGQLAWQLPDRERTASLQTSLLCTKARFMARPTQDPSSSVLAPVRTRKQIPVSLLGL